MKLFCLNSALIFGLLFSLEVLISNGSASRQCINIIKDMVRCSSRMPNNCDDWDELLTCGKAVVKRSTLCDDETALKIIKHYMTSYKISDKLFCQNYLTEGIMDRPICLPIIKEVARYWLLLTPGFLSAKGCKVIEPFLMTAQTRRTMTCTDVITSFTRLACPDNQSPKYREIHDIKEVYRYVGHCSEILKDIPQCDTAEKSRHLRCVEMQALEQIRNRDLKIVEDNLVEIATNRDKFICSSENVKDEIDSNKDCMNDFIEINKHLSLQINGYLTEDGCDAMMYKDFLKRSEFTRMDCPLLNDYWKTMRIDLSCSEVAEETTTGEDATAAIFD